MSGTSKMATERELQENHYLNQITTLSGIYTGKIVSVETERLDSRHKVVRAIIKDRDRLIKINARKLVDPVILQLESDEMHKRPKGVSWHTYYANAAKRMRNAVINYVIETGSGGRTGDRLKALAIIQNSFWFRRGPDGQFLLRERQIVSGRVTAVYPEAVVVDVFGVQIAVARQYIYSAAEIHAGNVVAVRLSKVIRNAPKETSTRHQIVALAKIKQVLE